MPEQYLTTALLVVAASAIWYVARQLKTTIITSIPGPPSSSFPLGNFKEYYQDEVGEHEFAWQERFGGVYRIKGLLGQDRLMISDPKALQYIYQNVDKNWLKPIARRELGRMFLGRGIAWSEAEDHKRHRKIMTPAFGNIESRGMMPVMRSVAQRMCQYWKNITSNSASEVSCEIEVSEWLSRATLDTIGEAAFNYQFGSMENSNNRLAQSYNNMLVDAFNLPSPTRIFAQLSLTYLPI
ncbi:Protein LUTEIN DEFICIENT 5, chloroplastic [Grifola frondosa]|uniref:Protein LUTEIN DEFICIENT 5, chloroplastic n=1 Tax=Grifola frondosa TaxID=5627 RepID=A0A1C7MQF6_GRIFR|nr:Protein LUTEIN DEFICIENT 5, chloroplastic [Grifola frondosa]